jgi:hypothetical protein
MVMETPVLVMTMMMEMVCVEVVLRLVYLDAAPAPSTHLRLQHKASGHCACALLLLAGDCLIGSALAVERRFIIIIIVLIITATTMTAATTIIVVLLLLLLLLIVIIIILSIVVVMLLLMRTSRCCKSRFRQRSAKRRTLDITMQSVLDGVAENRDTGRLNVFEDVWIASAVELFKCAITCEETVTELFHRLGRARII